MARCLGNGQRAVAGGLRDDPPRKKHDPEREQSDDEQRVSRVAAGDQAQQRQDGRDRAQTKHPERRNVGNTGDRFTADDDPRETRALTTSAMPAPNGTK